VAVIGKDYSPPKALRMHLEALEKNPPPVSTPEPSLELGPDITPTESPMENNE